MDDRNQAFLFLTHRITDELVEEYRKLESASKNFGEAWLLFQEEGSGDLAKVQFSRVSVFSFAKIVAMGYFATGPTMIPGNAHFPLLKFHREHPGFHYYWLIEYDVRFSGDWAMLFEAFGPVTADFVTCHIRAHADEPDWPFWALSHPQKQMPLDQRLRSFNPICRLSNAALAFVDGAQREGWRGHNEVLIPTLLHSHDFVLADFGGAGAFVPRDMENRFYLDSPSNRAGTLNEGTMRYRPVFSHPGHLAGKLYHPVKSESAQESSHGGGLFWLKKWVRVLLSRLQSLCGWLRQKRD